jgi:hypothetical protein
MQTSNRVLRNGMVNLSVDIEQELEGQIEEFAQTLSALNPANNNTPSEQIAQAARDAEDLREQVENLQQQALAFGEQQTGAEVPSIREMRDQFENSQQLAQNLQRQLQQQQSQQGGQQQGSSTQGSSGARQQIGEPRDGEQQRPGLGGRVTTDGNNLPWGNARSIRQMLTQQDIEDFLNQPELFRELLQPIIELEGALRAQAELDAINQKLYAVTEEDIPDEYRDLVQEYYRVLSENQESESPTQ